MDLSQSWYGDRYYCTLHFDTSPLTFTLIQGHGSARKLKRLCQLSHKVFDHFDLNLVYFWDLLVWRTSYSLSPFSVQGREPYLYGFVTKKQTSFIIGLYSDIYWW